MLWVTVAFARAVGCRYLYYGCGLPLPFQELSYRYLD